MDAVGTIQPWELADIIRCKSEKVLIVDARTFCEYNTSHIINSVNVWSSKIRKKRLQQNSISVHDFLQQACHISLQEMKFDEMIVYDQSATFSHLVPPDTFLHVLLLKLSSFSKVSLLQGGFLEFQSQFYEMCEDSSQKSLLLTSFSQPCLPISNTGPTKILPFLFLGSQHDANDKQQLLEHNIVYELNVSTSCPKPDFLQDSHFLRIAVNDNFSARLLPHFAEAFRYVDKVREVGGRVLVHCLAGISRSPTVVISYVMKYLNLHYDEAYRYVKTRRPTISPNINFVGQLLELDLLLFGDRGFCRSPPGALYLEPEYNTPCRGSSPTASSFLAKSSSSPCIESFDEGDFPFHRNRSLPSLRLQKSLEEGRPSIPSAVHFRRQSFLSPSSELASLSSNFSVADEPYVSDRLPSTPVFHEPGSVEYSAVLALCVDQTLDDPRSWDQCQPISGQPLSVPISEIEDQGTIQRGELEETNGSSQEIGDGMECRDVAERNEVTDNLIYKAVASITVGCPCTDSNIDVSDWTEVQDGADGVISTPNASKTTPQESRQNPLTDSLILPTKDPLENVEEMNSKTPSTSSKNEYEKQPTLTKGTTETPSPTLPLETASKSGDGDRAGTHQLQHSKPFLFPPAPSNKEGHFVSDSNNNSSCSPPQEAASSFPPKTAGKSYQPSRKTEPPYLPRSHSSSETYLNRRMRLERQAAANSGGANTRKSFSSDEVGRGFQSPCLQPSTPPTMTSGLSPFAAAIHKEPYTNAMELARCDSWSTSGLGSEISDWDSIQGDIQSAALLDDALGPFDAVFSDVFPGEGQSPSVLQEPPFKNLSDRDSFSKVEEKLDKLDQKFLFSREKKHDTSQGSSDTLSSKSGTLPVTEDPLVTCPTPRPVSLPGVSGTYNITDPNANVDLGVGLEESGEWHKGDVETVTYSPATARKKQLFEHPPVNPRTMGEDVKYIMTWYKIDSCRQQALSSEMPPGNLSHPAMLSSLDKERKLEVNLEKLSTPASKEEQPVPSPQALLAHSPIPQGDHKATLTKGRNSPSEYRTKMGDGDSDDDTAGEKQSTDGDPTFISVCPSGEEKESGCLQERWKYWDAKFKEKMKNIQRNVSLTSWDSVSGDGGGLASDNMAGFHLAKELMQSMEDLLEREIRDIKKRASALSSRFGLPVTSSSTRTDGGSLSPVLPTRDEDSGSSGFAPEAAQSPKDEPRRGSGVTASLLPREYPLPKPSSCRRENGLRLSPFALGGAPSKGRAKSEPPLCMEEGLYRVKSCPGIAQGDGAARESILKRMPREGGVLGPACSSFRFPRLFPSRNGSSKRFSCSALDFLSNPPPHFESSCPDVRETAGGRPSPVPFGRGESGSGGGSPSASFRLLKVS